MDISASTAVPYQAIQERIKSVLPFLNERQRRVYLAAEARSFGWGGNSVISFLSGVCRESIARGKKELCQPIVVEDHDDTNENVVPCANFTGHGNNMKNTKKKRNGIRKKGGGRKSNPQIHPELLNTINNIVGAHTMGDPTNPLIWSSKSTRKVSETLKDFGYNISHESARKCLKILGYSLQSNKKTKEGGDHHDRDAQFEHINSTAKEFLSAGDPVISVDCKKKELIGEYKNNGQEWTPVGDPTEVNVYDFIDKTNGKASPYGVYDIGNNTGWVSVGVSSDTASFAVSSIRSWWEGEGKNLYPDSKRLYINADGGGSNGSSNRLWKEELQKFSNQYNIEIHVSHFPPGTSKWNKIEHRLFSQISLNWRAKPLTSLLVILSLIGATTTTTGLVVKAVLDEKQYQTGIKITDEQIKKWNIEKNEFQGKWNYIIKPNL